MKKSYGWKRAACASLCAATLMIYTAAPAMAATTFTDVSEKDWYYTAVEKTVEAGLLSGTDGTRFSPGMGITRSMAVAVLWRLAGSPTVESDNSFSDVTADTWYTTAVAWAKSNGITNGNGKGLFQPNNYVTREQLAVFLYQYAQSQKLDTAEGKLELYSDASNVSAWAKDGMEHAVGAGLIAGTGNKLLPKQNATRAELAVIMNRLITPVMG